MAALETEIEKAALLHDIGKVCLRALPGKMTHSEAGVDFLRPFLAEKAPHLLRAVGHHHSADLKHVSYKEDDISYIIYEADNIAASSDRRKNEDADTFGFDASLALQSVFNVFRTAEGKETAFQLRGLVQDERLLYPKEHIQATAGQYAAIMHVLEANFRTKSPADMTVNELLQILENTMTYVPSSTAVGEKADISLYDHQKLTAAFAVSMYVYFKEKGITNYKKACYSTQCEVYRNEPMYLLVSGDISGIQEFIYTVPSKGALKSLRGRSLYLELLIENIADEILSALHMSRASLLYTGGGHFYMLLPNTASVHDLLEQFEQTINKWLLQQYDTRLYLAMAWTPCTANEFRGVDEVHHTGHVFKRVSQKLSQKKLNRYDEATLEKLFSSDSVYNVVQDGTKECGICHTSRRTLAAYDEDADTLVCENCRSLLRLGNSMLQGDVFFVGHRPIEGAVKLPGWKQTLYVVPCPEAKVEQFPYQEDMVRLYIKNKSQTSTHVATRLWMGDYVTHTEDGTVMDFSGLAKLSGGEDTGINRLAVMRADVDNLGASFIAGFHEKYKTLTRTAVLSRQLSLFFKRYMNSLCEGKVNGFSESDKKPFSLFTNKSNKKRNVHIIYSGGDDMFIVGAWDDVIELAVDIRRSFAQFTNGKLTFSAGIGFFKTGTPISQMARVAGELEDMAKRQDGKDSITLFGTSTEYHHQQQAPTKAYHWDEFVERVCGEKLAFLQDHFTFSDMSQATDKLVIGKSGLYRLMGLLSENIIHKESINLARFAYVLARMEPQHPNNDRVMDHYAEVQEQFYEWYKHEEDCNELLTAIQLVVYSIREKE